MPVKSVYKKYFQKSKLFLYPLLGIRKGSSVVPSETYIEWNDTVSKDDAKLVCLYHPRDDNEYKKFEKNVLLRHNRLADYCMIDEENLVVIFEFSDKKDDWEKFLEGRYSKMNDSTKKEILKFFDSNTGNYVYMKSYLHPDKYYEDYALCLNVEVSFLKDVGELCSKPDLEKEKLILNVPCLNKISN